MMDDFTRLVHVSQWVGKGSLIQTDGGVMIVHKVNRKNYVCYDENGECWNVGIASQKPLPADTKFDSAGYVRALEAQADRERVQLAESLKSQLTLGSIVEFTRPQDLEAYPDLYVCISTPTPKGSVRVAKVGGDDGRYITAHCSLLLEKTL